MNVLLVNPPCRTPVMIPLGLGYIASVLRQEGHSVSIMDLNAENKPLSDIEKELSGLDFDLIGIGGLTTTYDFVKSFSALAKKVRPDVKIMAGNMVSTAHPELLLQNSEVDICVIDEGEETVKELVQKIKNHADIETVKGIKFKKDDQIIATAPRERITNLDTIPHPAWELFPTETYINNPIHSEYGQRSMNVSVVRGCPFHCIYCSRPFGRKSIYRSTDGVIEEIKELKNRYKIEFVAFSDDLFVVNKKWVLDFCDEIINKRINIRWGTSARVNLVDKELLQKMRKAGCQWLSYGFESGSQKILDNMKKAVTVEQAEKAIDMTRRAGITAFGSFMIGMLGETEDTIAETVDFIKRKGLSAHRFFYATPYPSTPMYETAKDMGRLPKDENKYVSSLAEMRDTFLVNLTDLEDDALKALKQGAEEEVKKNFSLKIKMELLNDDLKRVCADFKKRMTCEGVWPTFKWFLDRARKRVLR